MSMAVTNRKGIEIVYEDGKFPAVKAYMITGKRGKPCVGTASDLQALTVEGFVEKWRGHAETYKVPLKVDQQVEERFLKRSGARATLA